MADPSATNHTAESRKAVAAFSSEDMTEYTAAHPGEIRDNVGTMPTPTTNSSSATSTINPTGHEAASTLAYPDTADLTTLESKPWPRLHLLGLPRELRDQIYKYAIVSDKPVNIGPGGRGRRRHFFNIPALTKVSRQLRHETRRMFLEQNTLAIDESKLITSWSSKPLDMLKALCADSELQNAHIYSHKWVGTNGKYRNEIHATLVANKTSGGLNVSLTNVESNWKVCSCRVESFANKYGNREGAIVRGLEALRQAYVGHVHYARDEPEIDEHEEHSDLIVGHSVEVCDIHLTSVLY